MSLSRCVRRRKEGALESSEAVAPGCQLGCSDEEMRAIQEGNDESSQDPAQGKEK